MVSMEANLDLGFATLTSSTSYYEHSGSSVSENTGFYAQAGFLSFYYNYPRPMASAVRSFADESFVQELRLVSNDGGMFDYVVGLYYQDQNRVATQDSYLRGFKQWWDVLWAGVPAVQAAVSGDRDFAYVRDEDFTDQALFGELTWHVTDRLDITGGVRAFWNEAENVTFMDLPLYTGVFTPATAIFSSDDSGVLWKLNAAFEFGDDDLLYATWSQGYRRGGTNAVPTSGAFAESPLWQVYDADRVDITRSASKAASAACAMTPASFISTGRTPSLIRPRQLGLLRRAERRQRPLRRRGASTLGHDHRNVRVPARLHLSERRIGRGFLFSAGRADRCGRQCASRRARAHGQRRPHLHAPVRQSCWLMRGSTASTNRRRATRSACRRHSMSISMGSPFSTRSTLSTDRWDFSIWVKNIADEEGVTGVYTEAYMGTAPLEGYFGNGSKDLISLPRTFGATIGFRF